MEFTRLTEEQRSFFDNNGYLIIRGALDQTMVGSLIAAGDKLIATEQQENRQRKGKHYDGFRNVVALDDAFIPLLTHTKTVPLIVQLLSGNIHLCTSHLIYNHPSPEHDRMKNRGWHRDISGVAQDLGHASIPRMEIKVAYYLTNLSEPNSGVTLFSPGSNHLKEPLRLPAGKPDPDNVLEASLQPGDAVLFENRTWHAVGPNLSNRTRKAVMFGYGYRWLALQDCVSYPSELIVKVDDIGKQLLDGLQDELGRYIPGGINEPLMDWCEQHGVVPAQRYKKGVQESSDGIQ
jgi:ectoine hydroxylase-related dioxygenase (phytanoyl-CoA dioxygenase family)